MIGFNGFGSIFWIVGIVCAIWVIYEIIVNQKKMDTAEKAIWIICAIIFSIITAIVYYFVKKR